MSTVHYIPMFASRRSTCNVHMLGLDPRHAPKLLTLPNLTKSQVLRKGPSSHKSCMVSKSLVVLSSEMFACVCFLLTCLQMFDVYRRALHDQKICLIKDNLNKLKHIFDEYEHGTPQDMFLFLQDLGHPTSHVVS